MCKCLLQHVAWQELLFLVDRSVSGGPHFRRCFMVKPLLALLTFPIICLVFSQCGCCTYSLWGKKVCIFSSSLGFVSAFPGTSSLARYRMCHEIRPCISLMGSDYSQEREGHEDRLNLCKVSCIGLYGVQHHWEIHYTGPVPTSCRVSCVSSRRTYFSSLNNQK